MEMKVFNVYYKNGYIGYVLVPDSRVYQEEGIYIQWLAYHFNGNSGQGLYEEIKANLTIEPKKNPERSVHAMFFKRMIFNDHELGDEFSFASV